MNRGPFTVDEYVRWSDVDKAGIIFYGAYVRFFEIAETELFRSAGVPYSEVFDRFNIWLPRVNLTCDFSYPARLDDRLRVAAYFTRFGTSSIGINFVREPKEASYGTVAVFEDLDGNLWDLVELKVT